MPRDIHPDVNGGGVKTAFKRTAVAYKRRTYRHNPLSGLIFPPHGHAPGRHLASRPALSPRVPRLSPPRRDAHTVIAYANIEASEIEDRIKELQDGLEIGRASCSRSWANQFRILLTAAAYVLMQELRLGTARTSGTASPTVSAPRPDRASRRSPIAVKERRRSIPPRARLVLSRRRGSASHCPLAADPRAGHFLVRSRPHAVYAQPLVNSPG